MTRVLPSLAAGLAFLALPACSGLDLSELRAPDQRSVNDSKGIYHRPSQVAETPTPAVDQPPVVEPAPPPAVGGPAAGSSGWADAPEGGQPPVFAPVVPSAPSPYPPTVAEPAPATPTLPAPRLLPTPSGYPTSTLAPPPPPPTISRPDQLAPAAGTSDSDPLYFNFMGQIPPELSTEGSWVTPASGPNLASLRGQVVFFVFSFQGCEGCKIFMPTLQQWAETYQRRGATILYVDNGAIDPLDYAKKAMKEQRSTYAYFHDAKAMTVKSYGVRSFPTAYLLDKQGRVIWQGCPTAREGELVPLIESALSK